MKSLIFSIALLFSTVSFASGKFIFSPEQSLTKDTYSVGMGLSIFQKVLPGTFFTNYTGASVMQPKGEHYDFQDFTFKNGVAIQPLDALMLEVGHEYTSNLKTDFYENKMYLKIAAQIW